MPLPEPEAVWPAGDLLVMGPEPLAEAHYAAFPRRLPREFIDLIVPKKACPTCGAGWAAVVAKPTHPWTETTQAFGENRAPVSKSKPSGGTLQKWLDENPPNLLGHLPTCGCYAEALEAAWQAHRRTMPRALQPFGSAWGGSPAWPECSERGGIAFARASLARGEHTALAGVRAGPSA